MATETVLTFTNVALDTAGILPLTSYSGSLLVNMNTGTVTGSLTVAPVLGISLTTYTSFAITAGLGGTYTITGTGQTALLVSSTITIQYTGLTPTTVSTQYYVLGAELASGSGSPITTAAALQPSVVPETASALSGMTAAATASTGVLQGASDPNGGTLSVYSVSNGMTTDTIASGSSATVTGTYGSLTLGSDGSYSYAANNGLGIVTAADGSPVADTFSYVVTDTAGASTATTGTFTVNLGVGGIEAVSNLSDATAPARFLNLGATRMNVTETVAGTYSGVIRNGSSGNVGGILSVSGTAPLTLTGVNTYTGKTSVSGILRLGAGSSIAASKDVKMIAGGVFDISGDDQLNGVTIAKLKGPAGTVQLGGRTLVLNTATAGEFDGTIVDGGASGGTHGVLKIAGTAAMLLGGVNTYTGKTAVSGILQLKAGSSIAASKDVKMVAGGVFDISADTGGATIAKLKGPGGTVELGAQTLTLNTPSAGEFDGTITDGGVAGGTGGSVHFAGAGAMLLTGASSYTGGSVLSGGTKLELANASAAGSGAITFSGAALLQLDAPALTSTGANQSTFANTIAGMVSSDGIELASLAYAPGATASIANGVLTTTSNGNTVTLNVSGVANGTQFTTAAGINGVGTLITQTVVTPGSTAFVYAPSAGAMQVAAPSGDLAPSSSTALADAIAAPSHSGTSTFTTPAPNSTPDLATPAHA